LQILPVDGVRLKKKRKKERKKGKERRRITIPNLRLRKRSGK